MAHANKPRIIKPENGTEYELNARRPSEAQKIALRAFASQDAGRIYWFRNNEIVAEGDAEETFFMDPKKGTWKISIVDSKGRSDSITIKIF